MKLLKITASTSRELSQEQHQISTQQQWLQHCAEHRLQHHHQSNSRLYHQQQQQQPPAPTQITPNL